MKVLLTCQTLSVFSALLGAMSTTRIQLLVGFTWNLVHLVDFRL